nr:DegT/DnrJ/EryC1/StrS family aminotransferase [Salicibibacter halophilus]
MSNIVAGVGGQLEVLDERVEQRRAVFGRYYEALSGLPGVAFMPELEGNKSNRWLTALTVDPEKAGVSHLDIIEALGAKNIEAWPGVCRMSCSFMGCACPLVRVWRRGSRIG